MFTLLILQSWDYNYQEASLDLYGDLRLLFNPDQVALDESIAWQTAFWYWSKKVNTVPSVKMGYFGVSTNAINGALECSGPKRDAAQNRFRIYKNVLIAFNVNETPIEYGCYN